MMNPVTVNHIKTAMKDPSFLATLPPSLTPEVQKFMANPGCGCNMAVYQKILKEAPLQIQAYFPTKSVAEGTKEVDKIMANQPQIQYPDQQQGMMPNAAMQGLPQHPNPQMQNQPSQQPMIQIPEPINNFHVINCSIGEVEERLKRLPNGHKQIAVARYEDQVTIIVNILHFEA